MNSNAALARTLECKHFGACGGCDLLNIQYQDQLRRKRAKVADAFAKWENLKKLTIAQVVPAPSAVHYRNRLLYPLAPSEGRVIGGFFKKNSHELVDVEMCQIQETAITELAVKVKKIVFDMKLPMRPLPGVVSAGAAESQPSAEAALRALAIRHVPNSKYIFVGFVTTGGVFPRGRELAERVTAAAEGISFADGKRVEVAGVLRNINDKDTNVIFGSSTVPLLGKDKVITKIGKFKYSVDLVSFFQPNPEAAARAAAWIARILPENMNIAVDCYAGGGFFSLYIADRARKVFAIEEVQSAARAGAENIKINNNQNIEFLRGTVEEHLTKIEGPLDLLFLDPPRSGLTDAALEAVVRARPAQIYYLSCSEVSLARDLEKLSKNFRFEEVTPMDFLPQTEHVEVFARGKLIAT